MIHAGWVLLVLGWRFVTGREMDGHPRTNATWRYPAGGSSAVLARGGRASWWVHQSRRYRAGVRCAALAVGLVFGWGMWRDPEMTWLLAQLVVGLTVLGVLRTLAYRVAERGHRRRLWRLHRVLAPLVGWPVNSRTPGSWLKVPWDFADDPDAQIEVKLPPTYVHTGAVAEKVEQAVAAVLDLPDPEYQPDVDRRAPVLWVARACPPPLVLPFTEVGELLAETAEGVPLLGMAARGEPVTVSLDSESPHVVISAGTGAGKTVLMAGVACQGLRLGAHLLIFDIKRTSHLWAAGLPGVLYCRTAEQIHNALVALGEEIDRRYAVIEAAADLSGHVDPGVVGPRLLILAEELNATMAALGAYWARVRPPGSPVPPSPAIEAWGKLLYMGRQGRMHILGVAQRLSARAGGGGDARENFGTRIMARASGSAWKMLAPEILPPPPPSQIPGRSHVVAGGAAVETQGVLWTPEQARLWACPWWTPGQDAGTGPETEHATASRDAHRARAREALGFVPVRRAIGAAPVLVTLREAVEDGGVPFSLVALRKRSQRDSSFPPPRGSKLNRGVPAHTYDLAELRRWAAGL